ncbi:MAG: hypothetical protein M1828_002157 [Chrysothrix sp. TS-e1954]|nr:MAG: hypothetical protein M1828_002157 [Chrysothrix sp. TS-e1954]
MHPGQEKRKDWKGGDSNSLTSGRKWHDVAREVQLMALDQWSHLNSFMNPLEQIEETNLADVLSSLRQLSSAQQHHQEGRKHVPYFNIKPLDAIVSVFKNHAKHRVSDRERPPVIEVASVSSGGGKTHLSYYAVAAAVLPIGHGGKQAAALVVDADGKFDVDRLVQVMINFPAPEHRTSEQENRSCGVHGLEPPTMEVLHALRHIHVFRPQSLASVIATLESLPDYLLNLDGHYSAERAVSLLVLDSAAAFFWQEKDTAEHDAAYGDTPPSEEQPGNRRAGYAELVDALKKAQDQFDCSILATSWGLLPAKVPTQTIGTPRPSFRPMFPPVWQNFCTCRMVVGRELVKRFPSGMSVTEAVRDQDARMSVVRNGRLWCAVDRWDLGESVRKGIREKAVAREFGWSIRDEGVRIDED